jgi:hypothetical protein
MSIQREPIYVALFMLLSNATGIVSASRRLKSFNNVSPADCPALFMTQHTESHQAQTKLPGKWNITVDVAIFVNTGANDPDVVPSSVLNPVLDAVTAIIEPPIAIGEQTLGGLVERCRIAGSIQIVEGVQDDTALAVIPVEIFLPDA